MDDIIQSDPFNRVGMVMCLIANSVATIFALLIMDWVNRRQRKKEDEFRFQKLCERIELERKGWSGEREGIMRRIKELEQKVMAYQKQLATQYRQQMIDHQGYIDKRIEALRCDNVAARLSDWKEHYTSPHVPSQTLFNPPSGVSLPEQRHESPDLSISAYGS
eukprot:TRINITY_DN23292_c0_g1_i1.p1 TRINITY_DN23292_c0_g1~~TRINITY_DN23292_c0_g1_i1.p1  ORF type:complete len:163 (+),score=23.88 TRINITY_DN23292_c0_g1_i1:70-558(+)